MMENNNDWFENLNYPSTDHQQQTFVTKHDLELLHKKIIATDLIVQKYQEANRALLRLQIENDDLRKQNDQITNECCIFSKQVTECTQECDSLKEQTEISNGEKRELHQQIRLLQDDNTSNHHEIMVLRQFESLKDTNEQLTKSVERQKKTIGKLQLQVQRKSSVIYKPIKSKQEQSEIDIALMKSQKSVLELRLALGRLVTFIQLSKIEIPTALHIRPVLKAHDITDDFLEIEGDIPRKPVKKISKPVISHIDDDDDDDDDDHGDFIDVNHSIPVLPVHTADVIEKNPLPSRSEQKKSKTTKKSRRKKDTSTVETPLTKLDELANELEMALLRTDLPASSLSDDDDGNPKTSKSDKHQVLDTNSTITISRNVNFFSDDDHQLSPVIEQRTIVNRWTNNSLQVDSITPVEIETSNKRIHYTSFLSEDDEENNKSISSMSTQEFISPLDFNESNHDEDIHLTPMSDKPSSSQQMEIISEKIADSSLKPNDQTTVSSSISANSLDSNHLKIVLRLLNVLTQVPVPLEPLRLIPRRIQRKTIPDEPPTVPTENKTSVEARDQIITKVPAEATIREEHNTIVNYQVAEQMEEPTESMEEISENQVSPLFEPQQLESNAEIHDVEMSDTPISEVHEEPQTTVEEDHHPEENKTAVSEVQQQVQANVEEDRDTEEDNAMITEVHEERPIFVEEDHHTEENNTKVSEIHQEQQITDQANGSSAENTTTVSEVQQELQTSVEKNPLHEQTVVIKQSSVIPKPQEPTPAVQAVQFKRPLPPLVLKSPPKSVLKPLQISIITRLLNTLINLPVKPLILPVPFPLRKRKRQSVTKKPSVPLLRQPSNQPSRSPTRMQTRSFNSIRARIARCNQPVAVSKKRTPAESISPSPTPSAKRIKSTKIEQTNNEYDLILNFLNSSSKEMNEVLEKALERKLHEDMSLLIDQLYRILSEFMMKKCDIRQPVNEQQQQQPYEVSIQTLLKFMHNRSSIFQQEFIKKLKQTFENDIKPKQKSDDQIKILNRLFVLTCSTFAPFPAASVVLYSRLFDIGYSLSHDIREDASSYVSNKFPSLISPENQISSSNRLLHSVLFEILRPQSYDISYEVLEDLLIRYQRYKYDQEDLIRSFILIFRHQTWLRCSTELCSKILFPLLEKVNNQYQRLTLLMILQLILSIYKDNDDFKRDTNFSNQLKQRLQALKIVNRDESIVRDNIFAIFCNQLLIDK